MPGMVIDFHTHIFPPRIIEHRSDYTQRDPLFAELYGSPRARLATADELIASMDENGVELSVALNIAWSSPELCRATNDYILESAARFPGRLAGFCALPPDAGDALKELERCGRGGIRGIGEMRGFAGCPPETFKPVMAEIIARRLVLLTHASEPVGHLYPGKGAVTPQTLYPLVLSYPELRLVCAHWGGGLPFYALMPEVGKALANVYFDTAASPFLYRPVIYRHVIDLVGADKIIFGSDYPLMSPARPLKEIKSVALPGDVADAILAANARRLLGINDRS